MPEPTTHSWNDQFCSCGSDTVLCQGCGHVVCGDVCIWVANVGNVEPACLYRFGLGHSGTDTKTA